MRHILTVFLSRDENQDIPRPASASTLWGGDTLIISRQEINSRDYSILEDVNYFTNVQLTTDFGGCRYDIIMDRLIVREEPACLRLEGARGMKSSGGVFRWRGRYLNSLAPLIVLTTT